MGSTRDRRRPTRELRPRAPDGTERIISEGSQVKQVRCDSAESGCAATPCCWRSPEPASRRTRLQAGDRYRHITTHHPPQSSCRYRNTDDFPKTSSDSSSPIAENSSMPHEWRRSLSGSHNTAQRFHQSAESCSSQSLVVGL